MLQHRMQHLFLYMPIFCAVDLFGFGGINMDNKYLNEVLERLESYRKKEQQIELLRYELQHAKQVSPNRADRSHDVPNPRRRCQPNGSIPKRRPRHCPFLPAHRRAAERRSRRRADKQIHYVMPRERPTFTLHRASGQAAAGRHPKSLF